MRNGQVTGEVATANTSQRELAELMVGRSVVLEKRRGTASGEVGLSATGLVVRDDDQVALDHVSLDVHKGEIVGIAGVAGNGQRRLARALAGIETPAEGSIVIGGVDVTGRGALAARGAGLAFVPEDRLGTGLVPGLSLTDNMLLTRRRAFFVDRKTARADAERAIAEYEIKAPGTEAEARVLSGGNAQKVLLARELAEVGEAGGPQVVIVSSPTRGLDVGAAEFVRGLLHEARERGAAVLVISEDLDEVRSLADRIAVLYRGQIALEGPADELRLDEIGMAMAGVDPAEVN
jgi:simple sugar transport system ATP-binding protein